MKLTKEQQNKVENGLNTGLDLGAMPIQRKPNEIFLAGTIPYEVTVEDGDQTKFFPEGERQKFRSLETMACTNYSTCDSFETQVKRMIAQEMIEPLDYILDDNKDPNISDRFNAKASGTTANGNNLTNPPEALRKMGNVPENEWPGSDELTWGEYYITLPNGVKIKAKELLKYFDILYETIPTDDASLKYHLKQAPIIIATACCPGWFSGGVVKACTAPAAHATLLGKIDEQGKHILDHYEPYIKILAPNYKIYYAVKMVVIPKNKKIMGNPLVKRVMRNNSQGRGYYIEALSADTYVQLSRMFGLTPALKDNSMDWSNEPIEGIVNIYEDSTQPVGVESNWLADLIKRIKGIFKK